MTYETLSPHVEAPAGKSNAMCVDLDQTRSDKSANQHAAVSIPLIETDTPVILAVDLGTTLGWALRFSGQAMSGTEHFKVGRFEGGGMRYLRFVRWLNDLWRFAGAPSIIYFEEVRRHRGVDAAHVYGGFLAQLTAWCEHHAVPYQGVPVGTIKKFATGKGNADKAAMIEAAKRWGYQPADDNEADALSLLRWAIAQEARA